MTNGDVVAAATTLLSLTLLLPSAMPDSLFSFSDRGIRLLYVLAVLDVATVVVSAFHTLTGFLLLVTTMVVTAGVAGYLLHVRRLYASIGDPS